METLYHCDPAKWCILWRKG